MARSYNEYPTIPPSTASRIALLFLIDTSASMSAPIKDRPDDTPIRRLCDGLNTFKDDACTREQLKNILDVAIVEFSDNYRVVQHFLPVEQMMHVALPANGLDTIYSPAIRQALSMVGQKWREYAQSVVPYKPWIVFITDGAPNPRDDLNDVAQEIKVQTDKKRLRFLSVGVGDFNTAPLHVLSYDKVLTLEENNFRELFDWVGKSMVAVSGAAAGANPRLPELTTGITRNNPQDSGGL